MSNVNPISLCCVCVDARQSTTDPITTIVAVELDSTDIRGKFIKSLSKLNPCPYNIDVPRTDVYCVMWVAPCGIQNQKYQQVEATSMPSLVWTAKVNDWHGLSGLIPTCHGIKLNSGLATYLRQGKLISSRDDIALLSVMIHAFASRVN